jgi:hypothetical protein
MQLPAGMAVAVANYQTRLEHPKVGGVEMSTERVMVEEPRFARLLFSDTRFSWLWLPLRLYLGYMWFEAGWH